MTREEFEGWKQVTATSIAHWQIDEVTLHNKGEYLIYKGGENGHFMRIESNGHVFLGTYEGAIPHINEAIFTITGQKKFKDQNEAITRCIEAGGLNFLLDFIGINAYPAAY